MPRFQVVVTLKTVVEYGVICVDIVDGVDIVDNHTKGERLAVLVLMVYQLLDWLA